MQSLCAEYAVVTSVTLPCSMFTRGTNLATANSPSVHGGRLAFWMRIAAAESSVRRKSGYVGNGPRTVELKDVSKYKGKAALETNDAVVKRKDVNGITTKVNKTEENMHAASNKCLFRSATIQL